MTPKADNPLAARGLPVVALGIRQPWAWCARYAGMDVVPLASATPHRGRVLLGVPVRRPELEPAERATVRALREAGMAEVPLFVTWTRGGFFAVANLVDCVPRRESPWWRGPWGAVLTEPETIPFIPHPCPAGISRPDIGARFLSIILGDYIHPPQEY